MLSTPHTVSHTTLETGSADALRAAVAELRGTVDALARTLAEMERKVVRARQWNGGAVVVVAAITAVAWWLGGSTWMRWGVAPVTVAMVAAFEVAHRVLHRRMHAKLHALQQHVAVLEARAQQLSPSPSAPA